MGRIILLLFVALGLGLALPRSRAIILDRAAPALLPMQRWISNEEISRIVRELVIYERGNFGDLPDPRSFDQWMAERFEESASLDAWGGRYTLELTRDSFFVTSPGPDGASRSADDLRLGRPRARTAR